MHAAATLNFQRLQLSNQCGRQPANVQMKAESVGEIKCTARQPSTSRGSSCVSQPVRQPANLQMKAESAVAKSGRTAELGGEAIGE